MRHLSNRHLKVLLIAALLAAPMAACGDVQADSSGSSESGTSTGEFNTSCEDFDDSRLTPRPIPESLHPSSIQPPIADMQTTTAAQGSAYDYKPVWWDTLEITPAQVKEICQKKLKAVIIDWSNVDQNQAMESGLKRTLAALGIEVIKTENYNLDPAQLQTTLSAILPLKPDIIFTGGPMNPKQYATILQPAVEQGIEIVSIFNAGNDPSWKIGAGEPLTSLVGYDFYNYGFNLGKAIGERYPDGATFGYLHWINDVGAIQLREQGVLDALETFPGIEAVADGGAPDPAGTAGGFADPNSPQAATTAFLQQHPEVNVLFASWEDPIAIGEGSAIASLGLQDKVDIVTMDFGPQGAAQLRGDGPITAVTVPPMYDIGYSAALAAGLGAIGAEVPPYILAPTAVATEDNVPDAWSFMHGPDIPCCG